MFLSRFGFVANVLGGYVEDSNAMQLIGFFWSVPLHFKQDVFWWQDVNILGEMFISQDHDFDYAAIIRCSYRFTHILKAYHSF